MNRKLLYTLLLALTPAFTAAAESTNLPDAPLTSNEIAKILDWTPLLGDCQLCSGYYREPKRLINHPKPAPLSANPTHLTATGPTVFQKNGATLLQKNVTIIQPGRELQADRVSIFRNKKTGKLSKIILSGHVRIREFGRLLYASRVVINVTKNEAALTKLIYRINTLPVKKTSRSKKLPENTVHRKKLYDGWGKATQAKRHANHVLELWDATYSLCSPLDPVWEIKAKKITIDPVKNLGVARNATIRIKHIPVMYSPYFEFPVKKERKSGLLAPRFSYAKTQGTHIAIPYYWNIAPNYDDTLTFEYYTKRGTNFNSNFRYLTPTSSGKIYVSLLPHDDAFSRYRQDMIKKYVGDSRYTSFINELKKDRDYRSFLSWNNTSRYNKYWKSNLDINYVTDPYYFRDFTSPYSPSITNQLLNRATLEYNSGTHWQATTMLEGYQTLHLIDQTDTYNQFYRLPEIDVEANYPYKPKDLDIHFSSQFVNFSYDKNGFPSITTPEPTPLGQRLHLRTDISRMMSNAHGYLTPALHFDETIYKTHFHTSNTGTTRGEFSGQRFLPFLNVDSGLFLSKEMNFHHSRFTQTLEPRLFYLYIPYVNQAKYPNFDTQLLPFSYNQLFSLNRFSGFDRVRDTNQISMGLSSRLLKGEGNTEMLSASLGMGYHLQSPRTCLKPNCVQPHDRFTPAVAALSFHPATHWSINSDFAWDIENKIVNNARFGAKYTPDGKHVIDLDYSFIHYTPNDPPIDNLGFSNNTHLVRLSTAWPITERWSAMASYYYNVSQRRPENYFGGFQYESCCWAVRLLAERNFLGRSPDSTTNNVINKYNTTFFVQLLLKGLGGVGYNDPRSLIDTHLSGLNDPFKEDVLW